MHTILKRIVRDTCGQDLIEYALIAGAVATLLGAGIKGMSIKINLLFPSLEGPMVRIICAVLAALFLGLIAMRRTKDADHYD